MSYAKLRSAYLVLYSLAGYSLLGLELFRSGPGLPSTWPLHLALTFFVFFAFWFAVEFPRLLLNLSFVYPIYVLGILVLGRAFVIPCFTSSLAWHYLEWRKARREGRPHFLSRLRLAWNLVRQVPILFLASGVYRILGGVPFSGYREVPWEAFLLGSLAIGALDYLSFNVYVALSEEKPIWRPHIPILHHFVDLPFVPLALPAYLLYRNQGIQILLFFSVPVIGAVGLAKFFLKEQAKKQESLEHLNVANELIRSTLDVHAMVKKIGRRILEIFGADGVEVFLKEEQGWRPALILGKSPWEHAPVGESFQEKLGRLFGPEPLHISTTANDPRFEAYRKAGLFSVLLIPLASGEETLGLILCAKGIPHYFFGDHLEFSKVLTGQVSQALLGAKLHEQLEAANRQLRKMNELKSQFLANVSHELRTPLTAITGYTNLLLDGLSGPLSDSQVVEVQKIARWSGRLILLINDLLDLSKIEAGKMMFNLAPFSLQPIIQEAVSTFSPMASEKGIMLTAACPETLPHVVADPDRVTQVLVNLIGNAIKFTEEGGITIEARKNGSFVSVSVQDTGIGIPEEEIPHIFDEFRQVEGGAFRSRGGTGLGLAIAKRLIELQNGTIWAESHVGRGSVFTFILPTAPETPA